MGKFFFHEEGFEMAKFLFLRIQVSMLILLGLSACQNDKKVSRVENAPGKPAATTKPGAKPDPRKKTTPPTEAGTPEGEKQDPDKKDENDKCKLDPKTQKPDPENKDCKPMPAPGQKTEQTETPKAEPPQVDPPKPENGKTEVPKPEITAGSEKVRASRSEIIPTSTEPHKKVETDKALDELSNQIGGQSFAGDPYRLVKTIEKLLITSDRKFVESMERIVAMDKHKKDGKVERGNLNQTIFKELAVQLGRHVPSSGEKTGQFQMIFDECSSGKIPTKSKVIVKEEKNIVRIGLALASCKGGNGSIVAQFIHWDKNKIKLVFKNDSFEAVKQTGVWATMAPVSVCRFSFRPGQNDEFLFESIDCGSATVCERTEKSPPKSEGIAVQLITGNVETLDFEMFERFILRTQIKGNLSHPSQFFACSHHYSQKRRECTEECNPERVSLHKVSYSGHGKVVEQRNDRQEQYEKAVRDARKQKLKAATQPPATNVQPPVTHQPPASATPDETQKPRDAKPPGTKPKLAEVIGDSLTVNEDESEAAARSKNPNEKGNQPGGPVNVPSPSLDTAPTVPSDISVEPPRDGQ